ncbi:MAG: hypothetical protein ACRED1_08000, partial [Limisphaerales bacterium]
IQDANTALANEANSGPAAQLKSKAQTQQEMIEEAEARRQRYDNAMAAGRAASAQGKFEEAIRQAKIALAVKSGDTSATQLQSDATAGLFKSYISAGNAALSKGNYREAMQYAKAAMAIRDDPAARDLQNQAESAQKTVTALDGQLSILMKDFGVDRQRGSSISPNERASKIAEIDDPRVVTQYLMLTTNLEAAYVKGGWLDLEGRRDILQHERRNLNNY